MNERAKADVFYLRPMEPPAAPADVFAMFADAGGCFDLYRMDWVRSYLAKDGSRMLCWYQAPDLESSRMALRQIGADLSGVWGGNAEQKTPPDSNKADSNKADLNQMNLVLELSDRDAADSDLVSQASTALKAISIRTNDESTRLLLSSGNLQPAVEQLERLGIDSSNLWSCDCLVPDGSD